MRTVFALFVMAALIAPTAIAGEMTPEEIMQKFMTCPSCAPYMEYPELRTGLHFDTQKTAHGMIVAQMLTDEALVPTFRECEAKLSVAHEETAKLSAAEAEEKLCPFCLGFHELMGRGDVELEEVKLNLGTVTLASSSSEEGVAAVHAYVEKANEIMAMMEEASAGMKEPVKQQ